MKRMLTFAGRTLKEILRDPLTLGFGLGFPIILLALLTAIQANIPFMTLFSANLISKDRESSLLQRLYTTPLTAADFIFGYVLPILPIALAQAVICYAFAAILGLKLGLNTVLAVLMLIPCALFFIALGLLCGSVMSSKQVGGICGALLTNLSAWLSGIWFDVEMVGKGFKSFANLLPFIHAVELERAVFAGDWQSAAPHLPWVAGYMLVTLAVAVLLFLRQMKKD